LLPVIRGDAAANLRGCGGLLLDVGGDRRLVLLTSEITSLIRRMGGDGAAGVVLDGGDPRGDVVAVAPPVSWARSFTSLATTADPFAASPARAASIVALRASRLVCFGDRRDQLDDVADLG
jgi:hypothetical protein